MKGDRTKIGIFDSGLGGITVAKKLIELLPSHDIIYLADTARFPYGSKSPSLITQYSIEAASFLLDQGVGAIVIACNTVCSSALQQLKSLFPIPFFDIIEPVAKEAIFVSKTKKIGLIATPQTVKTGLYLTHIKAQCTMSTLIAVPSPHLAAIVEQGCTNEQEIQALLKEYLSPMKGNIDTLILGCTHYFPLLPYVQQEVGENVTLVAPSHICAQQIASAFVDENFPPTPPSRLFFTTSDPSSFKKIAEPLLGQPIAVELATLKSGELHV